MSVVPILFGVSRSRGNSHHCRPSSSGNENLSTALCVLFQEKRHTRGDALITNAANPIHFNRAGVRSALGASDHPIDTSKVDATEIAQQRLKRNEAQRRGGGAEIIEAVELATRLD